MDIDTRKDSKCFPAIALAACLSVITPICTAAQIPFTDFARHEALLDVKISPDGEYLATTAVVDNQTVLGLIQLSDMKAVRIAPRGIANVVAFEWASPTRVLYTIGERLGALERPSATGEIYAVNADGSGGSVLFGARVGGNQTASHIKQAVSEFAYGWVVDPRPEDANSAIIGVHPFTGSRAGAGSAASDSGEFTEARRIDLVSGKTTKIASAPMRNADFVTDNQGDVRFAYGNDNNQKLQVWYREGNGKDFEILFDENKDGTRIFPLGFARDDKSVYFKCGGSKNLGGLCRWDVASRKLSTVWSGTEADALTYMHSFDGKDIWGVRSMPGYSQINLIDKNAPEAAQLVKVAKQLQGQDVRFASSSLDGKKVIVLATGDVDAGTFYMLDATTGKLGSIGARMSWLNPDAMATMEPIALKARDGLDLHGYVTRPVGKEKEKNLPMVVYLHGGPYGIRDTWDFDPYVQAMANRGYAVLQVNFRGSGGYGYDFEKAGYREWGGKMQDDVTDATRWAIQQGIADPKRICIFGGSYGGYAALEGAVKEPDMYRCAIGYVGVYDLRLMATRGDIPQSLSGRNYVANFIGSGDDLWNRSPLAHLDQLKAKVMIIVGGEDHTVPPIHGENLHAALDERHITHEWVYQRTEGHGFYTEANVADLLGKIDAFLGNNIGTPGKPSE
ncbi:MAG: S9 family peptidase [Dokdonella sp.]